MASLHARLLAGVVVLSALGLILLGGITYVEQRSFLLRRIDAQVRAAPGVVSHALFDHGVGPRPGAERPPAPGPGSDPGGPDGPAGPRDPGSPPPDFSLPPGTYGELRDASGKVLGSTVLSYGQGITARPALPARLKAGETLTVDGRSGADTRFRVRAESGPMLDSQIVVALPLRDVDETLQRLLLVIALVIGAILLALALAARTVIRIGLAPLDRIEQTAGAIAAGDLSHRVEIADPRTEVGRLGGAFNGMLDRLERAFAEREASEGRLRRFLADASHELRTPLASIRGYAELSRLGVVRADAETTRSMRRIEDEAARMGVLVEDLLTLARLDQVSEAARAPVDLARLAADAVEDARATARDREIALVAEPRATVLGDADQLRQVLGNLLRNALVHTPAGTPVEVTVSVDGLRVALEVRDHGAGLPTKRAEALFERFWRPGPGRGRQKDGGVGLGLAIVAGIVEAHHGTVEASDADGGGASFRAFFPSPRAGT